MGTVFRRPDGTWVGRRTVGGERVERQGRTQAEVLRKLAAAVPPGPTTTVAEWCARWLSEFGGRASTRAAYRQTFDRHFGPKIGAQKLSALTPGHVERAAARLVAEGLHPNTVRAGLARLSTCLRAAVRHRLIASNPAAEARRPKGERGRVEPFTPAELARIVAAASTAAATAPHALLAATGMRLGEAAALDVPDYDPRAGTVSVTKTYTVSHGTRPPKTANGRRVIRVVPAARAALDLARGRRTGGPLFVTGRGNRRPPQDVGRVWRRLLRGLGLAYRNPHQMRHSVITHLVAAGLPLADVAGYVGDVVATIVSRYVHPTGVDPSATLERLLGGDKVGAGAEKTAKPLKNPGRGAKSG